MHFAQLATDEIVYQTVGVLFENLNLKQVLFFYARKTEEKAISKRKNNYTVASTLSMLQIIRQNIYLHLILSCNKGFDQKSTHFALGTLRKFYFYILFFMFTVHVCLEHINCIAINIPIVFILIMYFAVPCNLT